MGVSVGVWSVNNKIQWTNHSSFLYVGVSRRLECEQYDGQTIQVFYMSECHVAWSVSNTMDKPFKFSICRSVTSLGV